MNVIEAHPAGGRQRCDGQRRVRQHSVIEHRANAVETGERMGKFRERKADQSQRKHEQREHEDETRHVADRQCTLTDTDGAEHEQPDVGERGERIEQRLAGRVVADARIGKQSGERIPAHLGERLAAGQRVYVRCNGGRRFHD